MFDAEAIAPIASGEAGALHRPSILLVDDNDLVRISLAVVLERCGFAVLTASDVNNALRLIASQTFDVLLSDLHMPGKGDGLTVVSAMRHANPKAITIIFSGYPEMKEAAAAILLQTDEVLIKPMPPALLVETILKKLKLGPKKIARITQTVAYILEQDTQATIDDWLRHVELIPDIITVPLSSKERSAHLPQLFHALVARLRAPLALGTRAPVSPAAARHGTTRRQQGYTATMIVEESRMLQVSIFQALQNNLHQVDFSTLLPDVMAIADEVDSQLSQTMASFVEGQRKVPLPFKPDLSTSSLLSGNR